MSFLRGQTHLLRQIVRRSSGGKRKDDGAGSCSGDADEDSTMVAMEVVRLRQEQKAIEDRVAAMWRRVQETERRPKQMLAFLVKVVGDPQVLRRLVGGGSCRDRGFDDGGLAGEPERAGEVKRARLLLDGEHQLGKKMAGGSNVAPGRLDGLFYDVNEDAFVPEASVDFTGFYTGGDGFGDVQVDAGGGEGGYRPYAFPVDSGY